MRVIRASELPAYLFCQRAWWYSKSGVTSENVSELAAGSEMHHRHRQTVLEASCLQTLGYILLVCALVLAVSTLTIWLL